MKHRQENFQFLVFSAKRFPRKLIHLNNIRLVQLYSVPVTNLKRTKIVCFENVLLIPQIYTKKLFIFVEHINDTLIRFHQSFFLSAESHATIVMGTSHAREKSLLWAQPDSTEKGRNINLYCRY